MTATRKTTDLRPPRTDGAEVEHAKKLLHVRKGIKPKAILWVEPQSIGFVSQQGVARTAHFYMDQETEQVELELLDGLLVF
jgi:hypothetical protein